MRTKLSVPLAAVVGLATVGFAAPAEAASSPPTGSYITVFDDGESFVRVSNGSGVKKPSRSAPSTSSSYTPSTPDDVSIQGIDFDQGQWYRPWKSETITPPGGSAGDIRARGQTHLIVNCIPFVSGVGGVRYIDTWSRTEWLGLSPFYASAITHKDVWRVSGVFIGNVTISGQPSGSIGYGSGRVEWITTSTGSIWWTEHGDNDLRFGAPPGGFFTNGNYDVAGSFQFGPNFYRNVNAYSGGALSKPVGC